MNPIKSWAIDDRPREKMLLKGKRSLSDAELLAIVIGSGTQKQSALNLAQDIMKSVNGDLNKLGAKSIGQLKSFDGIGDARAVTISAVMELARRKKEVSSAEQSKISSSKDAFYQVQHFFEDLEHEEFYAIYLNRGNKVLRVKQISMGGVSGTIADGKLIFGTALELKASAMILAHNHPSANLVPSESDKKLTSSLLNFGKFIEIQILDHLIINGNNYFSFADEGLMR
jgi:DNA repair protein RadC